ncbi:nuclear transport factor 2 family protein [Daejeonella oryzae]|uniref:nuclear transport factor 2 family protein n=1 Tax=Daejeonella oryzae TaxID=1122943 RepID=UPI000400C6BB|nr:nuclear transport factor 2 family protein [Daejeonella oryzae]
MRAISLFVIQLLFPALIMAQENLQSELFTTLQAKDSILFNIGFNKCDISQFEMLVGDDFEFYHDKSGITKSKSAFIESIKNGLCNMDYKARRELVSGSLEVYPLENKGVLYGAIQTGKHCFYEKKKDQEEYFTSIAKFTHVWKLENGNWKLVRGLSYDHRQKNE